MPRLRADQKASMVLVFAKVEGAGFVGDNAAPRLHPSLNLGHDVLSVSACYVARKDLAATFDHAEHDLLVALAHSVLAADKGLVGLDHGATFAAQAAVAINPAHVLADFVADAPSGFIGATNLALNFLGTQAVSGRAKQKHDIEPRLERRARPLERRSSHRVDMMPAITGIGRKLFKLVERTYLAAFGANGFPAVPSLKKMRQTGIVVWISCKELFDSPAFGHSTLRPRLM
jgi:hypothetical protein